MIKVYTWDEVGLEIASWEIDLPLHNQLSSRQLLILADDAVAVQLADDMGSFKKSVREENGVLVLDALFGRDKRTSLYMCFTDESLAKSLAEKEKFLGEDEEEDEE